MSKVVYMPTPRYVIQVGEVENKGLIVRASWTFWAASHDLDDAMAKADLLALDHEHVRVVDVAEDGES